MEPKDIVGVIYLLTARMFALGNAADNKQITQDELDKQMNAWAEEYGSDVFHLATGFVMLLHSLTGITWAVKAMSDISEQAVEQGDLLSALRSAVPVRMAIEIAQDESANTITHFIAGLLGMATHEGASEETLRGTVEALFPPELREPLYGQISLAVDNRGKSVN